MARKKPEVSAPNVLDMNANMQGTVVFSEPVNLRINGNFTGELKTKGILYIGDKAEVNAEINGEDITIAGRVKGNITAEKRITMKDTAVVEGDIFCGRLEVEEGAVFEGRAHMLSYVPPAGIMDLTEVARYLDVKVSKVEEWANQGRIPARRDGDSWAFDKNNIDQWLKANA